MSNHVTMEMLYTELRSLKRDVEAVKSIFIAEEKASKQELAEIKKIKKEMQMGKEKSFKDIFG